MLWNEFPRLLTPAPFEHPPYLVFPRREPENPQPCFCMNPNTRRQTNRLQFVTLLRGVIITAFLGVAGLSYVYLKNQMHVCGAQRKEMEQELHDLISENNVMEAQIARLTSRTALQRRLDEGFIKLVPISSQSLVRVHTQESGRWIVDTRGADDQIQTIAHERGTQP